MKSIEAHYSGFLSSCSGLYTSVQLPYPSALPKTDIPVDIYVGLQEDGTEYGVYFLAGRQVESLFLSTAGVYESGSGSTLRPAEEAASYPCLGFLLPPGRSKLFSPLPGIVSQRIGTGRTMNPLGDPCDANARCSDVTIRVGYSGNSVHAQWEPDQGRFTVKFGDKVHMTWELADTETNALPKQIRFSENDLSGQPVVSANLALEGVRLRAHCRTEDEITGKRGSYLVEKQGVGYGYGQQNAEDPWKFYGQQQNEWGKLDAAKVKPKPSSFPWLLSVITILVLALIVGVALRGKSKTGRLRQDI